MKKYRVHVHDVYELEARSEDEALAVFDVSQGMPLSEFPEFDISVEQASNVYTVQSDASVEEV